MQVRRRDLMAGIKLQDVPMRTPGMSYLAEEAEMPHGRCIQGKIEG